MTSQLIDPPRRRISLPRRQWVVVLLLMVAFGAGGALYFFLKNTEYSSSALVQIDQGEIAPNASSDEVDTQEIATQTLVVKSDAVSKLVIAALNLNESSRKLGASVQVSPINDSRVLRVTVTWDSPDGAASVANAYAVEYLKYRTAQRDERLKQIGASGASTDQIRAAPVGEVISPAAAISTPAGLAPAAVIALSSLLGALLGLVLVYSWEAFRPGEPG